MKIFKPLSATLFMLLAHVYTLAAQVEEESPYSASESFDPKKDGSWTEAPLLWAGLAVFAAAIIYVLVKGRRA